MNIEHEPYIFGSFTRRRHSQNLSSPSGKSSTMNSSALNNQSQQPSIPPPSNSTVLRYRPPCQQHVKSKSQPEESYHFKNSYENDKNTLNSNGKPDKRTWKAKSCLVQMPTSVRPRKCNLIPGVIGPALNTLNQHHQDVPPIDNKDQAVNNERKIVKESLTLEENDNDTANLCPLCKTIFLEPRVLNCLHTFCSKCLQNILDSKKNDDEMWVPVSVYSTSSDSKVSLMSDTSTSHEKNNHEDSDHSNCNSLSRNATKSSKTINRLSNTLFINHFRSNSSPVTEPTLPFTSHHGRSYSNPVTTGIQKGVQKGKIDSTSKMMMITSRTSSINDNGGSISCPKCECKTFLNRQGIKGLPLDYVVQHRLVLATLTDENTKLLCDICTGDVMASHRCLDCLINLCSVCMEHHKRYNNYNHQVLTIEQVRQQNLMRIHRRIMCLLHPESELTSYCTQCAQVICLDCLKLYHCDHICEPVSRAALARIGKVHRAFQKTKSSIKREQKYSNYLKLAKERVEQRCQMVEQQIEEWIADYKKAIEEHRLNLLNKLNHIRETNLIKIHSCQFQLDHRLQDANTTLSFTESLLDEGSDIELLTFFDTILNKFQKYEEEDELNAGILAFKTSCILKSILNKGDEKVVNGNGGKTVNTSGGDHGEIVKQKNSVNCLNNNNNNNSNSVNDFGVVQFLPHEVDNHLNNSFNVPLFGAVNDQYVSSKMSEIKIEELEFVKLNQPIKFVIICRDNDGNQMKYGGERPCVKITHILNVTNDKIEMEKNRELIPVQIEDKHDGTYLVVFIPKSIGQYTIDVELREETIQDSPIILNLFKRFSNGTINSACTVSVTVVRPHRGVFHCCSWCSSGGKKKPNNSPPSALNIPPFNGACGCGGSMPGGYQGCGHAHPGHPGKKHWSCCGSVQETGGSCTSRNQTSLNTRCTTSRTKNNNQTVSINHNIINEGNTKRTAEIVVDQVQKYHNNKNNSDTGKTIATTVGITKLYHITL